MTGNVKSEPLRPSGFTIYHLRFTIGFENLRKSVKSVDDAHALQPSAYSV
jgi:hypothetical protein